MNSDTRLNVERVRDTVFGYYDEWYLGDDVHSVDRDLLKLTKEEIESLAKNRNLLTERRKAWFDRWFEKQFTQANSQLGEAMKGLAAKTLGVVGNTCLLYTSPSPRDSR